MKELEIKVLEDCKNGDELAFNAIYTHYHDRVYFMAYNYFKDTYLAEDIVQETFVTLNKCIKTIDSIPALNIYVKKITYQRSMDALRKKKVYTIHDTEDFTIEDHKDDYHTLQGHISSKEINGAIIDSLSRMSFEMKSVGLLRFYEQLSIEDISEILNIPKGTVKSRINKIKSNLKDDLTAQGITPEVYASSISATGLVGIYAIMKSDALASLSSTVIKPKPKPHATSILALSASVIVTGALVVNRDSFNNTPKVEATENPKIETISYDKTKTNNAVKLDVKTSNLNYDELLINGSVSNVISNNGDYTVSLVKDNKEIDSKTVSITNIDTKIPTVEKSLSGNSLTLTFNDEDSGLDEGSLSVLEDNVITTNYTYSSGKFNMSIDKNKSYIIRISDKVGNVVEVNVKK